MKTNRLEAFCDGIFAIIITIMVAGIKYRTIPTLTRCDPAAVATCVLDHDRARGLVRLAASPIALELEQ